MTDSTAEEAHRSVLDALSACAPPPWIRIHGDAIFLEERSLVSIAEAVKTPIFLYSTDQIRRNVADLRSAFGPATALFASYKACYLGEVLREIHAAGIDAEVCSAFEHALARRLNLAPDRIVWNAVALSEDEVGLAVAPPPVLIGLNTLDDIRRLNCAAAHVSSAIPVMLRIHPKTARTAYVARGSRLGFDMEDGSALAAVRETLQHPHLDLLGLHYHIDTQQTDGEHPARVLEGALRFARDLAARLGWRARRIGIGGGLASSSRLRAEGRTVAAYAAPILQVLAGEPDPPELAVEPGRYFTEDAAVVVTRVVSRARNAGQDWLIVDANSNTLVPFEGRAFPVLSPDGGSEMAWVGDRMSTTTGVIGRTRIGPDAGPGSLLLILNAGAYALSTAQNFMYGLPKVAMLSGRTLRVLRETEDSEEWMQRNAGVPAEPRPSSPAFFTDWVRAPLESDAVTMRVGSRVIMHQWEEPLMQAFADALAPGGKDLLEIGFGMGLAATAFEVQRPRRHVIYEPHPEIFGQAQLWRSRQAAPERIVLEPALWQSIGPEQAASFDVIFFDGCSEPGCDHGDARQFTELAARLLRRSGRFAFFTMEPHLSPELQALLFEHFDRVELTPVRGLMPSPDFAVLGVTDTMIVCVADGARA